ncbi:hypothetical protein PR202_gb07690 [Eleusine coracana subsp. coracana]|uniref:Uncharacterized protein n=1 Tax=Eleusine coracana subsp. coracana TaxID=191504 RepID=A0AAV5ECW1_ELECO|nr:hypothetical protein PR202_gb07690 [Eleusine coracana subsp. coracana]
MPSSSVRTLPPPLPASTRRLCPHPPHVRLCRNARTADASVLIHVLRLVLEQGSTVNGDFSFVLFYFSVIINGIQENGSLVL